MIVILTVILFEKMLLLVFYMFNLFLLHFKLLIYSPKAWFILLFYFCIPSSPSATLVRLGGGVNGIPEIHAKTSAYIDEKRKNVIFSIYILLLTN